MTLAAFPELRCPTARLAVTDVTVFSVSVVGAVNLPVIEGSPSSDAGGGIIPSRFAEEQSREGCDHCIAVTGTPAPPFTNSIMGLLGAYPFAEIASSPKPRQPHQKKVPTMVPHICTL